MSPDEDEKHLIITPGITSSMVNLTGDLTSRMPVKSRAAADEERRGRSKRKLGTARTKPAKRFGVKKP